MEYNPAYVGAFVNLVERFNSFFLEGNWWQAIKTMRLMVAMLPPGYHQEGNTIITSLIDDLRTAEQIATKNSKSTEQQTTTAELLKGELIILARQKLQNIVEQSSINKISQYFNYQITA